MFENLQRDANIADETDFLGGGGPLETDVYSFVVDMAYIDKSSGGAMSLNLQLKTADGKSLKQTIYVTSGDAKGNRNYYMVKKNGQETGEKRYLPGFNVGNAICLLAIGKELSQLQPEEKTINVYDFTQSKEVPQKKDVLMELLGAEIDLGVRKQIVDKNKNVAAPGQPANYQPTGETRAENEIDKVFRSRDGMTVAEVTAQAEESTFRQKWVDLNQGKTRDKSTAQAGGATQGLPTASAAGAAPGSADVGTSSIFS